METSVLDLITLRRLPTGRRRFALGRVRELASGDTAADTAIVALCDAALEHDAQTAELQARRARASREQQLQPRGMNPTVRLDNLIDRTVSSIDGKIAQEVEAYEPQAPEAQPLRNLRAFLFPSGVAAITRSTFVEQLQLVKGVLARSAERQPELAEVGALRLLTRLQDLSVRFEGALKEEADPVTADQVRAATNKGNRLLRAVVVRVLAETLDEEDAALMQRRATLLAPILEQNEQVGLSNRQSRRVTDVDPKSGAEVEAPADE